MCLIRMSHEQLHSGMDERLNDITSLLGPQIILYPQVLTYTDLLLFLFIYRVTKARKCITFIYLFLF